MFIVDRLVETVVIPGGATLAFALPALAFARARPPIAGALLAMGVAAGFIAAEVAIHGMHVAIDDPWPIDNRRRIIHAILLALAGAIATGALPERTRGARWVRWGVAISIGLVIAWFTTQNKRASAWDGPMGLAIVGVAGALIGAQWRLVEARARADAPNAMWALVIAGLGGLSGGAIFVSNLSTSAQLSGAFAIVLVIAWSVLHHKGSGVLGARMAGPAVVGLMTLWLGVATYADMHPLSALVLGVSPAIVWIDQIGRVRRLARVARVGVVLASVAVAAGVSAGITALAPEPEVAPEVDDSPGDEPFFSPEDYANWSPERADGGGGDGDGE